MSPNPGAEASLRGTVLCIEDHPINMALVETALEDFPGVRLLKAFTGMDGVRLAQAELPDMVLLDMNLPDISGLEVVRSLSEQISQRRLHVVLLTADDFSMEVVKAMSLGAHDHWRKPLTSARLSRELSRVLPSARAAG